MLSLAFLSGGTEAVQLCDGVAATIVGSAGDDDLVGTPGDDVIVGLGGDDRIDGRAGNDLICGGAGRDVLIGGRGDDAISGGAGADRLLGRRGMDSLDGGRSTNDQCSGGRDNLETSEFRNCEHVRFAPEYLEARCEGADVSELRTKEDNGRFSIFGEYVQPAESRLHSSQWGYLTILCDNNGAHRYDLSGGQSSGVSVGDVNGDGVDEIRRFDGNAISSVSYFLTWRSSSHRLEAVTTRGLNPRGWFVLESGPFGDDADSREWSADGCAEISTATYVRNRISAAGGMSLDGAVTPNVEGEVLRLRSDFFELRDGRKRPVFAWVDSETIGFTNGHALREHLRSIMTCGLYS